MIFFILIFIVVMVLFIIVSSDKKPSVKTRQVSTPRPEPAPQVPPIEVVEEPVKGERVKSSFKFKFRKL